MECVAVPCETIEIVLDGFPGLLVDHYIVTEIDGKIERHNLDVQLNRKENAMWLRADDAASRPAWLPREMKWYVDRAWEGVGLLANLQESQPLPAAIIAAQSNESVPEWFIGEDAVSLDDNPFDNGSFGSVYRGVWGSGTRVVVKRLLVQDSIIPADFMQSFFDEADVWYRLRHPHVIPMLGACHTCRPPFMVCEEASNGNLAEYLSDPANVSRTWELLYGAALGLEYLHEQRIVHGDLKCNNILVAKDGSAKLADFGFSYVRTYSMSKRSKVDSEHSGARRAGGFRWRAPECFDGKSPSMKSDVYSFAMCILEAVTQDVPWGRSLENDDIRYNVTAKIMPCRPDDCALLSGEAWALVVEMAASKPELRPDISAVARRLKKLMQSQQIDIASRDVQQGDAIITRPTKKALTA